MKMLSMSRMAIPARVRRRVTPSPASTTYDAPLTIRTFDDCARPTVGPGPPLVPNVMRRVSVLGGVVPPLFCAPLSAASTAMLILINVVHRKDDSFCIFRTSAALVEQRIVGKWETYRL